jgi:UDP-N-acetylmuramyl pentapeptide phosphotransferase/UDP-N-acetylglucosamine-1-phosphate transferase/GAF domain-containing protein
MIHISQNYTKYLVIPLLGFLVSYLLVPAVMAFAVKIGMVDKPDERRIHKGIIPRGGGLAVFVGFHLACAAVYFLPWYPFDITLNVSWWLRFLPASVFLLIVGVADDRWGVSPRAKLGCQVLAALALYVAGIRFGAFFYCQLPQAVDVLLTVLWCVGFINAFNLIDGLDGLAAGLGTIAAAGLAGALLLRHLPGDALVLLGFIGACLAFLRYNFNPARVFLGDTGSMFIGLTLAAISLSTASKGAAAASFAVPLMAAGIPILDTALAIWRRSARKLCARSSGGRVFGGDTDHLHHRLLRYGGSQKKVATSLYIANALLVGAGLLSIVFVSWSLAIYLATFVVGTYITVRHIARAELWASGLAAAQGLRQPCRNTLFTAAYPMLDVVLLIAALAISVRLTHPIPVPPHPWMEHGILLLAPPFLFMGGGGIYDRVWSRARPVDFVRLVFALLAGIGTGAIAVSVLYSHGDRASVLLNAYTFGTLAAALIVGVRLLPGLLQDALPLLVRTGPVAGITRIPALVYGAGYGCSLFMRATTYDADISTTHRTVVGILDDDSNLHGRKIFGCCVLGGIESLEEAVARHGIREIVITTFLDEPVLRRIEQFAARHAVRIFRWRTDIRSQQFADLHFAFDRSLGAMTSRIIDARPETLQRDLERCLKLAASFAGADACCAVIFTPGAESPDQTSLRAAHDSPFRRSAVEHLSPRSFPHLTEQLRGQRIVRIRDVAQLPPEAGAEIAFLQARGVRSALVAPIGPGGKLLGFMCYCGARLGTVWDAQAMDILLKLQADILAMTLLRLPAPPWETPGALPRPDEANGASLRSPF